MPRALFLPLAAALSISWALAEPLAAQEPVFRLFGGLRSTETLLVDGAGSIVHTWPSTLRPGLGVRLARDGTLLRAIRSPAAPNIAGGTGGGIQRLDLDGSVLWDYRIDAGGSISHHDLEELPNGNILVVAWEDRTRAQAIADGRDPAFLAGGVFRPDHLMELRPQGANGATIVWEWRVRDHLVQDFDSAQANFGNVAAESGRIDVNFPGTNRGSRDFNHINGIDYDPINQWIVLSAHAQNEVWILDHSTTTAEAATSSGGRWGRGGEILYRWGNPAAYRAAGPQQLFGQHAPRFLRDGQGRVDRVLLFNNRAAGGSAVLEIQLPLDSTGQFLRTPGAAYAPPAPSWSYSGGFQSNNISSAERLPGGGTLICSGAEGRIFEIDSGGSLVFDYRFAGGSVFQAHAVERSLWADRQTLSMATGGTVGFDVMAGGSAQAGHAFALLASGSGTSPGLRAGAFRLPLVRDAFFDYFLSPASSPFLTGTLGVLDARGRAQAAVTLPSGAAALVGLHLDFAAIAIDPQGQVSWTTQAVPLDLLP